MAAKKIAFDQEAREGLRQGVKILARAVKVTLGPRGRCVILEKSYGSPTVANDGVTVAKEIELEDKYANMGAQFVKEVASKTNDVAGDGTTTSVVLAEAIFDEGLKNVTAGASATAIKRGIDKAVAKVIDALTKMSTPVNGRKDIAAVASIAANNDNGHRQQDRRRHGQGRQRRLHHGRRRQVDHDGCQPRRRHELRSRLPLAPLRHQRRRNEVRARKRVRVHLRKEALVALRTSFRCSRRSLRAASRC